MFLGFLDLSADQPAFLSSASFYDEIDDLKTFTCMLDIIK